MRKNSLDADIDQTIGEENTMGDDTLVIYYDIHNSEEDDGGYISMENKIEDINVMVDLEYSSGSSKNVNYKDIEVEPNEKEIRNFDGESLHSDRCLSLTFRVKEFDAKNSAAKAWLRPIDEEYDEKII